MCKCCGCGRGSGGESERLSLIFEKGRLIKKVNLDKNLLDLESGRAIAIEKLKSLIFKRGPLS